MENDINLNTYLKESTVNEFLGTLFVTSVLFAAVWPLFTGNNEGNNKDNSESFKDKMLRKKEQRLDRQEKDLELRKREDKLKEDEEKYKNSKKEAVKSMILAEKMNKSEKDKDKQKENENTLNIVSSCLYDENGKEVKPGEASKKLEQLIPDKSKREDFLKTAKKSYDHVENNPKLKKELQSKRDNISADEYNNYVKKTKDSAKNTWKNTKNSNNSDKENIKKDKNGNVLKNEKVTDPKTGEKIKVVTHTGPRGGKFYWPKGAPKTPEHKVYVKESLLSQYLLNKLNQNK